jgi:hypothetical protein
MKKFEYKIIAHEDGFREEDLNELGADGWELVEVLMLANIPRFGLVAGKVPHFIFKREAQ